VRDSKIYLEPLNLLTKEDLLKLLSIRNQPAIREKMYSDHLISEFEHFNWAEKICKDKGTCPFSVRLVDILIGYASISKIDTKHKSADWAFYIGPEYQNGGLGAIVEFKVIEYAFTELKIEKLNCEVISSNEKVVKMHEKFGFKIEGVKRKNVIKSNLREDVTCLGLLKEEWDIISAKFNRMFGSN
jgi:UDP-4-amino-4,6-dideoxy-N-acetyl-beta-L-altrosamine N-acetyltransferase